MTRNTARERQQRAQALARLDAHAVDLVHLEPPVDRHLDELPAEHRDGKAATRSKLAPSNALAQASPAIRTAWKPHSSLAPLKSSTASSTRIAQRSGWPTLAVVRRTVVDGTADPVVEQREREQDAERRGGGADAARLVVQHRGGPEHPDAEHVEDRERRPERARSGGSCAPATSGRAARIMAISVTPTACRRSGQHDARLGRHAGLGEEPAVSEPNTITAHTASSHRYMKRAPSSESGSRRSGGRLRREHEAQQHRRERQRGWRR